MHYLIQYLLSSHAIVHTHGVWVTAYDGQGWLSAYDAVTHLFKGHLY